MLKLELNPITFSDGYDTLSYIEVNENRALELCELFVPSLRTLKKEKELEPTVSLPFKDVVVYNKDKLPVEVKSVELVVDFVTFYFKVISQDYILYMSDWTYFDEINCWF